MAVPIPIPHFSNSARFQSRLDLIVSLPNEQHRRKWHRTPHRAHRYSGRGVPRELLAWSASARCGSERIRQPASSNFFEEYVYRGFILAALAAALGFWPAVILSSIMFGATHTQYPLVLQGMIAALSVLWSWAGKRGGGLMAPYAAHMTLDWILDPVI
jgi:hypothetical protein